MPMQPGTDLKACFFEAFASRPLPEADRILVAGASDDGESLRVRLASRTATGLSAGDIRDAVTGRSWMLTAEAFRYFLPAFLWASLDSYASVNAFVPELVDALTEPRREDVLESLDRLGRHPPGIGLSRELTGSLRKGQLERFDSGAPTVRFRDRFDELTEREGAAVAAFLAALMSAHAADFPFQELEKASDRSWSRYRDGT